MIKSEIGDLLKSEIEYFKTLKSAIGDINGHIHSLAVKAAYLHLSDKHPKVKNWYLSETYGKGIDIIGKDPEDKIIVAAEVKTTLRAEKESLGSQQRSKIKEDITKLRNSDACHKYLVIVDKKNRKAIEGILKNNCGDSNIELINIFE
jgi:hypothetical protein